MFTEPEIKQNIVHITQIYGINISGTVSVFKLWYNSNTELYICAVS
jgi:hypothetical protein